MESNLLEGAEEKQHVNVCFNMCTVNPKCSVLTPASPSNSAVQHNQVKANECKDETHVAAAVVFPSLSF